MHLQYSQIRNLTVCYMENEKNHGIKGLFFMERGAQPLVTALIWTRISRGVGVRNAEAMENHGKYIRWYL